MIDDRHFLTRSLDVTPWEALVWLLIVWTAGASMGYLGHKYGVGVRVTATQQK